MRMTGGFSRLPLLQLLLATYLLLLSTSVNPGFGLAIFPGAGVGGGGGGGAMGLGGSSQHGVGAHPAALGAASMRGGLPPSSMMYGGAMTGLGMPAMAVGGPMRQMGFNRPIFPIGGGAAGVSGGPFPYSSMGGYGAMTSGNPMSFGRCNGRNCGYWGGCHAGQCGAFYDFRPCHEMECWDGPIHGFDCMNGSCRRVCNEGVCRDYVVRSYSGKDSRNDERDSSPEKEDSSDKN